MVDNNRRQRGLTVWGGVLERSSTDPLLPEGQGGRRLWAGSPGEAGHPASAASAIDTSTRMTSATERQSPLACRFGCGNSRASAALQVRQVLLTSGERPVRVTGSARRTRPA